MTSDQQRREVAARLRNGHRRDRESQGTFIARMVKGSDMVTALDVCRLPKLLADLIDRPTCKNVGQHGYFCCSRCKFEHPIAAESSTDTCGKPIVRTLHFNYCPNCEAEVVDDAQ